MNKEFLKAYEEIEKSFKVLSDFNNVITIFGSARIKQDSKDYQKICKLAKKLGKKGYSIMSGGGPGIMEAANKGLLKAKKLQNNKNQVSIGLNIQLPFEQEMNPYVEIPLKFEHFFSRKLVFNYNSTAFIVAKGGFGTLDELSEVLVQISTGKHKKIPIILYDKKFWKGMLRWFKKRLLKEGLINLADLELLQTASTPKEVLKILKEFKEN
ncbi:Rossman fold protein, TIGR00730 family [Helicobacter valdiviensis]|uniref:Cytokinin riboside 5'-monophosphate phosphoribohydrolase n=1 Tax=Helicobacter valdiviensis TaxID=1458358 RepID=A0A2W6NKG3_9HELI|nr:TIGR00730 family Rossman fold protein [Helicobacter valdiviensis]PZT47896.1 Rossman fold protein, TIGR00730 family [Helicobacter valdiviensis]